MPTKPTEKTDRLITLLDSIAKNPPRLAPLVVAVTSADGCETARRFVTAYGKRVALIPHMLSDDASPHQPTNGRIPGIELLNNVARGLTNSMPSGTGKFRPFLFETCYDVTTAKIDDSGLAGDERRALRDHLYEAWEPRKPLLKWIRDNASSSNKISEWVIAPVTMVFSGPNRWWFGHRLNRGKLRWVMQRAEEADSNAPDFLAQAVEVAPVNAPDDETRLLWHRIAFEALVRDLSRLTKRRKFLPHHRRRRWTPVLCIDCTGEQKRLCLDLVQTFAALSTDVIKELPASPLLIIAAMEPDALESNAGSPLSINDAATRLRKFVNGDKSALNGPWLPVQLTPEPEERATENWLATHKKVTPQVPGPMWAWAPVALTAVIALAATSAAGYEYWYGSCRNTWRADSGELVGLSDGACQFTPVVEKQAGFPDLADQEKRIQRNNSGVDDELKSNADLDYRYVVFFAPLTRPNNKAGVTAPANALWQLEGAIQEQKRLNELAHAEPGRGRVRIKLMLANSGDHFQFGDDVAQVIKKQSLSGPGSIAAVIGISQSRDISKSAIVRMPDVPVIGASVTGSTMADGVPNFFMIHPSNAALADKMKDWIINNKYQRLQIEEDPGDKLFSVDLDERLTEALRGSGIEIIKERVFIHEGTSNEGFSQPDAKEAAEKLCKDATHGILPVLTGRADELKGLFLEGDSKSECYSNHITMLAGYGAVINVASKHIARFSKWLTVAYTAFANGAESSDIATGTDALRVASQAINDARDASGGNVNSNAVLYQLAQGFHVDGVTGSIDVQKNDHNPQRPSERVKIFMTPVPSR